MSAGVVYLCEGKNIEVIAMNVHGAQNRNGMMLMTCFIAVGFVLGMSDIAMAITAPASGGFMYDVYDIGVNKILKGAPGFVIGCGAIGWGGSLLFKSQVVPAVMSILGGGIMLKADSIVGTLGLLIY